MIFNTLKYIFTKYNKINLLFFLLICIITCCLFLNWYIPAFDSMKEMDIIIQPPSELKRTLSINFYWVMLTIIAGYYAMTSYNEINNKKELFPAINKFFSILIEGIKYIIGTASAFLFYNIIPIVLYYLGYSYKITILFIVAPLLLITSIFMFVIPATLNYLKTLNLKDFFEIKKISDYKKICKENYLSYTGNLIQINIIFFIIFSIFFIGIITPNLHYSSIDIKTENYDTFLSIYTNTIKSYVILIHALFFTQLLMIPSLNKKAVEIKIKKRKINKKEIEIPKNIEIKDEDFDDDEFLK